MDDTTVGAAGGGMDYFHDVLPLIEQGAQGIQILKRLSTSVLKTAPIAWHGHRFAIKEQRDE
jgi:hypothetical protein